MERRGIYLILAAALLLSLASPVYAGDFINNGSFINSSGETVNNDGNFTNDGSVTNGGSVTNSGEFTGRGQVRNVGTGTTTGIADVTTVAEGGVCGDGLVWTFDAGVLAVTGYGDMYDYGNETAPWNPYLESISIISITDDAASIGAGAFRGCVNIPDATIPDNVKRIGARAFENCQKLEAIWLPEGLKTIEQGAFEACFHLKDVYFNGSESDWNQISIQGGNERLHHATLHFEGGTRAPEQLSGSFWSYDSDSHALTISGEGAIPDYVSPNDAPWNEHRDVIQSVAVEHGVTAIGSNAFNACSALREVAIPDTVTIVESSAFDGCTALITVNFAGTQAQWDAISIDNTDNCNAQLLSAALNCNDLP